MPDFTQSLVLFIQSLLLATHTYAAVRLDLLVSEVKLWIVTAHSSGKRKLRILQCDTATVNAICTGAVFRKTKSSSVMYVVASSICRESKISHQYCLLTFTPGLMKTDTPWQTWKTSSMRVTGCRMLCSLPSSCLWYIQSIILTVKVVPLWPGDVLMCFVCSLAKQRAVFKWTRAQQ